MQDPMPRTNLQSPTSSYLASKKPDLGSSVFSLPPISSTGDWWVNANRKFNVLIIKVCQCGVVFPKSIVGFSESYDESLSKVFNEWRLDWLRLPNATFYYFCEMQQSRGNRHTTPSVL